MADFIRIHHADTEEETKRRYDQTVARLEEFGVDEVRAMRARDDFPPAWGPIIREWLKRKRPDGDA